MANPKTEPKSTPHPSPDMSDVHWNLGVSSSIPDLCLWGCFVSVGALLELLCRLAGQFSPQVPRPVPAYQGYKNDPRTGGQLCQCWWCISNVGTLKDQNHFKTCQPYLSCAPDFPWMKYRGNQVKALRGSRGFSVSAQHGQQNWRHVFSAHDSEAKKRLPSFPPKVIKDEGTKMSF